MLRKVLGVLCLAAMFVPYAIEQTEKSETISTSLSSTTTTTTLFVDHVPLTAPPTTTTIAPTSTTQYIPPKTTTTSTESTLPAVSQKTESNVWDELAECESDGNWALDALYDGGLQFDPEGTWTPYVAAGKPYALEGYPQYAYQATREQQITVAIRVRDGVKGSSDPYLNAQGYGAWPTCRHEVGV